MQRLIVLLSQEARKDFRAVIKLKPKDQDAQKKLAACEKYIKEDLFLKAIESEQTIPMSQQVAWAVLYV
jgi:hypothetical protein